MTELTEITLCSPNVPESLNGLRIVHVSDMHIRGYGKHEKKLHTVLSEPHDLLLITGDFCWQRRFGNPLEKRDQEAHPPGISKAGISFPPKVTKAVSVCKELFKGIAPTMGIYASQGNHDPDELLPKLEGIGIKVLSNTTTQLEHKGTKFNLAGIRCYGRSTTDITNALLDADPVLFSICLSHYPDIAESLIAAGLDLILCGHTHGGQICLKENKPLNTHSLTDDLYASGLTQIDRSTIYTSRGLGYSLIPLRTYCPAEVTRFTLKQAPMNQTSLSKSKI